MDKAYLCVICGQIQGLWFGQCSRCRSGASELAVGKEAVNELWVKSRRIQGIKPAVSEIQTTLLVFSLMCVVLLHQPILNIVSHYVNPSAPAATQNTPASAADLPVAEGSPV